MMSGILSSDSQLIHDELEKAKETVSRLRCINGFTPGFCRNNAVCQGCWRYEHDVTVGKCSDRDGKYSSRNDDPWESINRPYSHVDSDGYGSSNSSFKALRTPTRANSYSREKSGMSRAKSRGDLDQIHKQINSLEKNIRGPILSYIHNIEQQNQDLADAVESIQQQLLKHEHECPAGGTKFGTIRDVSSRRVHNRSSEGIRTSSEGVRKLSEGVRKSPEGGFYQSYFGDSEKDELMQRLNASYKSEQACRFRADSLEKELSICREKLEKAEARIKEMFKNISQRRISATSGSSEMLLESQLQRQQQLAEGYLKESTSKERELSFLTIEKYNLQSEVSTLLSDLESCNRKRNEMSQEQKKLQATLGASRQTISDLQNELATTKSENRRLKSRFRDELGKERAVSEQKTQKLHASDRELKEMGRRVKKYEQNCNSHKDDTYRLEHEKVELLSKAKQLNNELKVKESECSSLQKENERLTKEITNIQHEASLSKRDSENANVYVENLKSELKEAKISVKTLEQSLAESKVNEFRSNTEINEFISKEVELKTYIENTEREKMVLAQELTELRKREVEFANEVTQMKENYGTSEKEYKELNDSYSALKTELDVLREKYLQMQKTNDELVTVKNDLEKSADLTKEELTQVTANYNDLVEKNGRISSDLKAYKRIVGERNEQLTKMELELNQLHKEKDKDLKDLLRKDKEIAFLKARVASVDRNTGRSLGTTRSLSQSNLSTLQYDSTRPSKETEIYLERIVELESECKLQKNQIEKFQKKEFDSKKEIQRSDSLKLELAHQDEEIQKLKREISRSKQVVEDLRIKEEQLGTVEDEREKLRQEVAKLLAKVQETAQLKQDWEQKEQEIKALRRMSSDEADLEGKVSRFKDRCREKDEEIEELHKKVIALQVKIKDFVQQNSQAEEQVRNIKEKYATELNEKETISLALSASETKCRTWEEEVNGLKSSCSEWEGKVMEMKTKVESLESENEESNETVAKLTAEIKKNEEEMEALQKQVQQLEEAVKQQEETMDANDTPDGASTPLDNSLDSSKLTLNRNGRASALDRLDTLEEENIQLLNRQSELEDELDAAEQHAEELKSALKAKRENVNDLHSELDILKERMKSAEKSKAELIEENEQLQQTCLLSKRKSEDLKVANERYMEESDELEMALTTAEQRIDELEKRLEEVSGKCASSEGQLQSMSERFTRKEKELEVVENQVDEQRKLCDGYKASAEKQEILIEKLRAEKTSAEEALLAMKLEMAKKEVTYKGGKEKVSEMQSRLYETEDKFSSKTNELKKVSRENERLKREIKELESKVTELQTMLKKSKSLELEKTSPVTGVFNSKFQTITTSLKGNTQNMEGLDTKLNQAQNKISSLEVELANDLRKYSLYRTSSDSPRRSFSPNDTRLSPGSYNLRRPRSYSNLSADDRESPMSSIPRSGSSPSINGDIKSVEKTRSTPEISTLQVGVNVTEPTTAADFSLNLDGFESDREASTPVENQLGEADPFLNSQTANSSTENLDYSEKNVEIFNTETDQELASEAISFFQEMPIESSQFREVVSARESVTSSSALESVQETVTSSSAHVQETVTSSSALVTGSVTILSSPSLQQGWNGEEELIYF